MNPGSAVREWIAFASPIGFERLIVSLGILATAIAILVAERLMERHETGRALIVILLVPAGA